VPAGVGAAIPPSRQAGIRKCRACGCQAFARWTLLTATLDRAVTALGALLQECERLAGRKLVRGSSWVAFPEVGCGNEPCPVRDRAESAGAAGTAPQARRPS